MSRSFWFAVIVAAAGGCAPSPSTSVPADRDNVLDAATVLEIARAAVSKNDTWVDRAEFETPERQPDGSWSVLVWRLPAVPGGHRMILINEKGQVSAYMRGN